MVIELVEVTLLQPPDAAIVLVTVYVPAVLAARLTSPVRVFVKTSPEVDEKVPALPPPLNTGKGFASLEQ